MTTRRKARRRIAAALTLAALVAAPAQAAQWDQLTAPPSEDERSADARDAGNQPAKPAEDLRSPDARTPGPPTWPSDPVPIILHTPSAPVADAPAPSFQWGDAALGAVGAVGLVLLLAGGTAALYRRRGIAGRPATS